MGRRPWVPAIPTGAACRRESRCRAVTGAVRVQAGFDMGVGSAQLTIGAVARRAGMKPSRIRYYESIGVLPAPDRVAGKRRYSEQVLRRLAIIDAAQRVGFTLDEIRELLGSRDQPAQERLRRLALLKLPELDALIAQATSVRRLLEICSTCNCDSIDVCRMFADRALPERRTVAVGNPGGDRFGGAPLDFN
jgi:MerR family transcriptional regulator, redox-sensitive transcriptional activator SoxR